MDGEGSLFLASAGDGRHEIAVEITEGLSRLRWRQTDRNSPSEFALQRHLCYQQQARTRDVGGL